MRTVFYLTHLTAGPTAALDTKLKHLSLSSRHGTDGPSNGKSRKPPVADSWEEEEQENDTPLNSNSPSEAEDHMSDSQKQNITSRPTSSDYPSAPPPTPVSPTLRRPQHADFSSFESRGLGRHTTGDRETAERPEKTTAAASRMIAAGLGVRAPRRTEEERKYDKALAENERSKRESERERKRKEAEEMEKAKRDIWDG